MDFTVRYKKVTLLKDQMRVVKEHMRTLEAEIREQEKELRSVCPHANTCETSDHDYHRPRYFVTCRDCGHEEPKYF